MPPTHNEARQWIYWLRVFTPSDLAESMAVDLETVIPFLSVMARPNEMGCVTIVDTGDRINGNGPVTEPIFELDPPREDQPRFHPVGRSPEEIAVLQMGGYEILSPRGMPVRIRTEREDRIKMSTPGARGRMKRREQRYQDMQRAVQARRQRQQELAAKGDKSHKRKVKHKKKGLDW